MTRRGAWAWFAFLAAYKAGDAFGAGMLRPFLVDRGLDLSEIGVLLGTAGFSAGLVGALAGGVLVNVLGRLPALVVFGVTQAVAVAAYALVAADFVANTALLPITVLDHLAGGMATAAVFTLMMDACRDTHEGADYTLQACLVVVATGLASAVSGVSAAWLGHAAHFVAGGALSLFAALAAVRAWRRGGFTVHGGRLRRDGS